MELSEHDSGGRRTLRVGGTVSVLLPERATTGYRWYPDGAGEALALTADSVEASPGPGARGAAGRRRLTFTALRAGPVRLHLVLRRAWEPGAVAEFVCDLEVLEA